MAATQVQIGPSPVVYAAALAARRRRAVAMTTRCVLGKPCPQCKERWYTVTYRGRKAIKAVCYSGSHSAPVPTAQDRQFFRKLHSKARKSRRAR